MERRSRRGRDVLELRANARVDATGRRAAGPPARRASDRPRPACRPRGIHPGHIGRLWPRSPHVDRGHPVRLVVFGSPPDGRQVAALMTDADLLPPGWGRTGCLLAAETPARTTHPGTPRDSSSRRETSHRPRRQCLPPGRDRSGLAGRGGRGAVVRSALVAGRDLGPGVGPGVGAGPRRIPPGDGGWPRTTPHRCGVDFAYYLHDRDAIYGRERRWPDSAFWRRRHTVPATDIPTTPTDRPVPHTSRRDCTENDLNRAGILVRETGPIVSGN